MLFIQELFKVGPLVLSLSCQYPQKKKKKNNLQLSFFKLTYLITLFTLSLINYITINLFIYVFNEMLVISHFYISKLLTFLLFL